MDALGNTDTSALVEAARALGPQITACRDEIERERRLPPALVDALAAAGLFRLAVPPDLGGAGADPLTVTRVVEEVARADGSTGWCVMIANQHAGGPVLLAPEVARTVLGPSRAVVAGSFLPRGRARPVPGGYRVTGQWPFVSGCDHATWFSCACTLEGEAGPVQRADGTPEVWRVLVPAGAGEVLDTWTTTGLRGTASHDVRLTDVFVPAAHMYPLPGPEPGRRPRAAGALLFLAHGAHALGVARGALAALVDLAATKTPATAKALLREEPSVQLAVGQAEALVGSARAYLYGTAAEVWATSGGEAGVPAGQRVRLRLAMTHAVRSAVEAVDLMFTAGGATAIFASHPLDRQLRDVRTAAAHFLVAPPTYAAAGRVLLGLEADFPADRRAPSRGR